MLGVLFSSWPSCWSNRMKTILRNCLALELFCKQLAIISKRWERLKSQWKSLRTALGYVDGLKSFDSLKILLLYRNFNLTGQLTTCTTFQQTRTQIPGQTTSPQFCAACDHPTRRYELRFGVFLNWLLY